jgi:hypothetical protein
VRAAASGTGLVGHGRQRWRAAAAACGGGDGTRSGAHVRGCRRESGGVPRV